MSDLEAVSDEALVRMFLKMSFDKLNEVALVSQRFKNITKLVIENHHLTAEQREIANLTFHTEHPTVIKVIGYAGTGKTTALKILCEKNPEQKFFMVVFSDSAKEHADAIFPKNVKCMTVTEMVRALPIDVLRLVPEEMMDLRQIDEFELTKSDMTRTMLDSWVKLWQLQKPSLQKLCEHDVLLVEEGPEIWPDMLDILLEQETSKIIVGEPRINKFTTYVIDERHKRSLTFYEANAFHTIRMTEVVRYGPAIAILANNYHYGKNRDNPVIKGSPVVTDRVVSARHRQEADVYSQTTFISFTKYKLFDHMAAFVKGHGDYFNKFFDHPVSHINKEKVTGYIMGGIQRKDFQDLLDLEEYHKKMKAEGKEWRWHTTDQKKAFEKHYKDYKGNNMDEQRCQMGVLGGPVNMDKIDELMWKYVIVEKYNKNLKKIIDKIEKHLTNDPKNADFIYCTVDHAKGRDWDSVVMLEDFACSCANNNLMYTAVTRARRQITLNFGFESTLAHICAKHWSEY